MVEDWLGLIGEIGQLSADLVALLLAFGLALLIRTRLHALVAVADLWLLMEILTAVADPDYRFGALLLPRLFASAAQVMLACAAVRFWRYWRMGTASVAAD